VYELAYDKGAQFSVVPPRVQADPSLDGQLDESAEHKRSPELQQKPSCEHV
jgi:hypothetical protein